MNKLYEVELNNQGAPNFATAKEVPQRMRGKWIQADKNEPYFVQCSVCRYMTDNESDYCPNCGADMRGGQNGTT